MKKVYILVIFLLLMVLSATNCAPSESAIQTAIASTAEYEEGIKQETQTAEDIIIQKTADARQTEQAKVDLTKTAEALAVSQTQTAIPVFTTTYDDKEGDTNIGFLDILQAEAVLVGENLTVTFFLADIPAEITINTASEGRGEYGWSVDIDVDQNNDTGTKGHQLFTGREGIDHSLSLFHFSFGEEKTGPIETVMAYDASVWSPSSDGMGMQSDSMATFKVDYDINTISLTGRIPGINEDSLLYFHTESNRLQDSLSN